MVGSAGFFVLRPKSRCWWGWALGENQPTARLFRLLLAFSYIAVGLKSCFLADPWPRVKLTS